MHPPALAANLQAPVIAVHYFGVLALQADCIDQQQFTDACGAWAARKDTPLAEILIERGWISPADRADVERLVVRKLRRHGGDERASLAECADARARDILKSVADSDVRQSISSLPPAAGHVLIESMPQPVATMIPQTQERLRYSLTRLHGEGGLGKVWIARDQDLNREVALKELQPQQSQHPEALSAVGSWRRQGVSQLPVRLSVLWSFPGANRQAAWAR